MPHIQSPLNDYTIKELEDEIKRRKDNKPKSKDYDKINWVSVVGYAINAVKSIDDGKGIPKDFEQLMMELVMETVYGVEVWEWWNDKLKGE